MRSRRMGRPRGAAALLLAGALSVTGCIGATDRSDFETEMATRSGGISPTLTRRAIAAIEDHLGTSALSFRRFEVDGRARVVSMEVRDPRQPANVDRYRFHDRALEDPEPVQVSRTDNLEVTTFRVADVPALGHVDQLVQRTLDELDIEDALVQTLTVTRDGQGGVHIWLAARSARSTGSAVFDGDGELLSAGRS